MRLCDCCEKVSTVTTIRVSYHHEDGAWWADSPDLQGWAAGGASLAEAREQVRDGLRFFIGEDVEILEGDLERPVVVQHVVVSGAGHLSDASGTTASAAVTWQPTPMTTWRTHSPSENVRATA
jgi:predicted RNase H-like HicB family nuclease